MLFTNTPQPSCKHDWLMVSTKTSVYILWILLLKRPEIAAQCGPSKLIIKGGSSQGAFKHNLQRRSNPLRFLLSIFPGLDRIGETQVGDRKPGDSSFRLATTPGSTLISNLASGAGRRPGKG